MDDLDVSSLYFTHLNSQTKRHVTTPAIYQISQVLAYEVMLLFKSTMTNA